MPNRIGRYGCAFLGLLSCVFPQAASEVLQLQLLSNFTNARCLDGTPAGYYHRLNGSSTRFVVYLQGGAFCTSLQDCLSRSRTLLGSSRDYPPTRPAAVFSTGIVDPDPIVNPEFCSDNLVFVPYCSGDNHVGTRTDAVNVGTTNLYFAGHLIVQSVFQDLSARATVSEVVFGGSSAGALGVVGNLDAVQRLLPTARVAALLNAGYFVNGSTSYPTFSGQPPSEGPMQNALQTMFPTWQGYVNPACRSAYPSLPEVCLFGQFVRPFLSGRVFWAQAMYDSYQIFVVNQAPASPGAAPLLLQYVTQYGAFFQTAFAPVLENRTTGVFEVSCVLHVIDWQLHTVRGVSLQQAFGRWYFGGPSVVVQQTDAYVGPPCNPTCAPTTCPVTSGIAPGTTSPDSGVPAAFGETSTVVALAVAAVGTLAATAAVFFGLRFAAKRWSRKYQRMPAVPMLTLSDPHEDLLGYRDTDT